jgi:hypothetical protein
MNADQQRIEIAVSVFLDHPISISIHPRKPAVSLVLQFRRSLAIMAISAISSRSFVSFVVCSCLLRYLRSRFKRVGFS